MVNVLQHQPAGLVVNQSSAIYLTYISMYFRITFSHEARDKKIYWKWK